MASSSDYSDDDCYSEDESESLNSVDGIESENDCTYDPQQAQSMHWWLYDEGGHCARE